MATNESDKYQSILKAGLKNLKASSCTFYVRDPWWPNQLRLAFMHGVKIIEPMHGFLLPATSSLRITGAKNERFSIFEYAQNEQRLFDQVSPNLARLVGQNKLFGNFAQREEVRACARLRHIDGAGDLQAVLWVNYCDADTIPKNKKRKFNELLNEMVGYLPDIQDSLCSKNPIPPQLAHILQLAEGLNLNDPAFAHEFASSLLKAMFEILKINDSNGYGSIYLFDSKLQTLKMEYCEGGIQPQSAREADVARGEGIISWVALKRRALLIAELARSEYRKLYRQAAPEIVSELAVPMVANDQLLGVINLECKEPFRDLDQEAVRSIWYGANQAAMVYYLTQQVERTRKLLKIAHNALDPTASNNPLNELAVLASGWFDAADCEIWPYLLEYDRFAEPGSSYDRNLGDSTRPDGWCQFVRQTKIWVWIHDVSASTEFNCRYWDSQEHRWRTLLPHQNHPKTLSTNAVNLDVTGALGIPITVNNKCIGVAWLKYKQNHEAEPSLERMSLLEGFAAQCGLVLDVVQHNQELAEISVKLHHYRKITSPTKAIDEYPRLKGYVLTKPHGDSEIGGDFTAHQAIDATRTAFLVGDARGHGLMAAFSMLPMSTVFRTYSRESVSAKHLLWKLLPVCNEWKLEGTAICFILDMTEKLKPRIFASSAAHPSLIIYRNEKLIFLPDPKGVANIGGLGHGLNLPIGEEVMELEPDDLIIAYTDGITDAGENTAKKSFGVAGINSVVYSHSEKEPEEIAREIEKSAHAHANYQFEDDVTIMVLKVMK
ncbi:MAG: SpoIIE family protein phosphatase [Acidobacteria bacterium]|nr:SpoIIE family protein phosphatase [Acidobacteriota bacterium]MBI3422834.1 SpoIIE family protein phosphatase [Acidobacteriota bacterium]